MPETPASVVIACTANGEPFSGAYVFVRLPMWHKNQYVLPFGPSDDEGFIRISGPELKERADEWQALLLMDYETFPERWTGGIGAEVLTAEGIEPLRSAMETWGPDFYPPQLVDDLQTYEARLRDVQGQALRAEVARTD